MLTATASVGIIGGGISGLSCALRLRQLGFSSVVVYDTGARGVGGRASSRALPWPSSSPTIAAAAGDRSLVIADHAAQFFVADEEKHPSFSEAVKHWQAEGIVQPWVGTLGRFDPSLSFQEFADGRTRWIGTASGGGLGGIAAHMAAQLPVSSVVRS